MVWIEKGKFGYLKSILDRNNCRKMRYSTILNAKTDKEHPVNNFYPHYTAIIHKHSATLPTNYSQDFHRYMWIRGTLVLLHKSCYDEFETKKGVLPMAMLSDEMLLESYYMANKMQLDHDFIALLLAEIHRRKLQTERTCIVH